MSEGPGSASEASHSASKPIKPGAEPPSELTVHTYYVPPFKLRFPETRELGRSYVSAVKPLGLPSIVSGKFYRQEKQSEMEMLAEEAAYQRVHKMFIQGPREKSKEPILSSHEYGWHKCKTTDVAWTDRRFNHHICDSAWLKSCLTVLAHESHDAQLKQRPC